MIKNMSIIWKTATFPTIEEVAKEMVIKRQLTTELGRAVRALQQENIGKDEPVFKGDSVENVCTVLEAILIHGLKDKLSVKVTAVFGTNSDKMPEPDFWPVVMVYSHKDVLSEIGNLGLITTDIGRGRAWLRIALNEGLIVSYIDTMLQDKSILQSFYRSTAYLRDDEQPDIMKQFLEGLNVFNFHLTFNCSDLNTWTSVPLVLAGIWNPPTAPQPVMPAVDVVDFFTDQELKDRKTRKILKSMSSVKNESMCSKSNDNIISCNSKVSVAPVEVFDINIQEHSALPEIKDISSDKELGDSLESLQPHLGQNTRSHLVVAEESTDANSLRIPSSDSVPDFGIEFLNSESDFSEETEGACGNKLCMKSGWSSAFEFDEDSPSTKESDQESDSQSYDSLLQSYNRNLNKALVGTPEITEIMTSMIKLPESESTSAVQSSSSENSSPDLDYEIVPKTSAITSDNADERTRMLLPLIGKLCPEQGLDAQNYQCRSCGCPIGMIYGKSHICYYDGFNYCYDCHENEEYFIPARIIHNWDFRRYPVSKHTKAFLTKVEEEPLINIKVLNPLIYAAVEEMAQLQTLRTQLSFLRSYIFTCKESIAQELRKKLWPREYLYEHIHLYAVNDLLQIPTGVLVQTLQRIIAFAKKHVLNCQLCNLKGFICEVCNSPKVIYPFDIEVTYHCEQCLAVYHSTCMDANKPCPKCERKRKRQEMVDSSWSFEED